VNSGKLGGLWFIMTPLVTPPVVKWFRVYAGAMAGIYLLLILVFAGGLVFAVMNQQRLDAERAQLIVMVGVLIVTMLPFLAAFVASLFLKARPWVWVYDLVLITFGFTGCLTLPFAIALLIYWIKPETKAYFGRT
jgi:hypothetical protein